MIAEMQARYAEETGVRQLKIRYNNMLGYYIETPQAAGEFLLKPPHSATFIHRQTMAGAMRFATNALIDLEARIASAADRALGPRARNFCAAGAPRASSAEETLRGIGAALAEIDVALALAELAVKRNWTRPRVDRSLNFRIEGGRHPVVEAALSDRGETFTPNDCDLSGEIGQGGKMALVTGPNMAGKSTFLRQNALIAALAQMGSFVPAKSARVGVVDRLFSRVGAADDLARGRSTFMVEMVETAAILNQAGERSLVILDEIGRGTATFDGLSLAFACVEHLNSVNRSRILFATHFHELTSARRDDAAPLQSDDEGARMERAVGVLARGRAGRGRSLVWHPSRQARRAAGAGDQARARRARRARGDQAHRRRARRPRRAAAVFVRAPRRRRSRARA